jgi:hypothetical protein
MIVIYLAGPYRSDIGPWGVAQNIERAREAARELWKMGLPVICPHANTAMMDGADIPVDLWLDGDIAMMERCDAVVVLPGWESSAGTKGEIRRAEEIGIPVYYWPTTATGHRDSAEVLGFRLQDGRIAQRLSGKAVRDAAAILGRHAASKRRRPKAKRDEELFPAEAA